MPYTPPPSDPKTEDTMEPEQEEFPIEDKGDRVILGVPSGAKGPAMFSPGTRRVFYSDIVEREEKAVVRPREEHEWELEPGEKLGEFLERVGEEVGWERLSDYAREHLESED